MNATLVDKGLAAVQAELARQQRRKKPYRTEHYGKWAAGLIQQLHSSRTPLRIKPAKTSVVTSKIQYYQGAEWAAENIPGIADLLSCTICRSYRDYFELHIRARARSLDDGEPHELPSPIPAADDWRAQFELLLDTGVKGDKIDRRDVCLSEEDMRYVVSQLLPLEGVFAWVIEERRLLVVRIV